jgi:hypothetical protein
MPVRELPADVILAALRRRRGVPAIAVAMRGIEADGRPTFNVTESPASVLRKALDLRYKSAHRKGSRLTGDADLLDHLAEMGDLPISGLTVDDEDRNIAVFSKRNRLNRLVPSFWRTSQVVATDSPAPPFLPRGNRWTA